MFVIFEYNLYNIFVKNSGNFFITYIGTTDCPSDVLLFDFRIVFKIFVMLIEKLLKFYFSITFNILRNYNENKTFINNINYYY